MTNQVVSGNQKNDKFQTIKKSTSLRVKHQAWNRKSEGSTFSFCEDTSPVS